MKRAILYSFTVGLIIGSVSFGALRAHSSLPPQDIVEMRGDLHFFRSFYYGLTVLCDRKTGEMCAPIPKIKPKMEIK